MFVLNSHKVVKLEQRKKDLCCVMYSVFLNQASFSSAWQERTHLNYDKFQIGSNEAC